MADTAIKKLTSMEPYSVTEPSPYEAALKEVGYKKPETTQQEKFLKDKAEADIKVAGEKKRLGEESLKRTQEIYDLPELQQQKLDAFTPSQESGSDLAKLFALTTAIAFIGGGRGRYSGMTAMNNLASAMEGYRKGRKDLFAQEMKEYDKNMKASLENNRIIQEHLKKYLELAAKKDANAATELEMIKALTGRQGALAEIEKLTENDKAKVAETLAKSRADWKKHVDDMMEKERRHKESTSLRERANELAERRLALQEERLRKGEGGKPLKETEVAKIEGLQSLSKDLQKLKKEFKDEYASLGLLGLGADLSYEAKRRLGDEEGRKAVQWWSKYERLQAPNRHALFGATLTGNELKNYLSFTAKKSDNPQVVRDMLQDQSDYVRGTADSRALSYESAGYKVPDRQPRSFTDTYSGSTQAAPAQRPVPTEADRERGRSNPASRENFIRHFGEEP